MPPMTKEAQRAEVHKTIWRIANDLRGSVDGCDFKSYVIGMLFYRFISENLAAYINKGEREAGNGGFDHSKLADSDAEFGRTETVAEKGLYILPSELFVNVRRRAPNDENLNETLERRPEHSSIPPSTAARSPPAAPLSPASCRRPHVSPPTVDKARRSGVCSKAGRVLRSLLRAWGEPRLGLTRCNKVAHESMLLTAD